MELISRHYNIPVFVPEEACPNRCVFCNQYKISGSYKMPSLEEVKSKIEAYLNTFAKDSRIEIAFFGGNFTGIDIEIQKEYLDLAQNYVNSGLVHGIRLSTRPDYIDEQRMQFMAAYSISCIELGAQSLDNEVLKLSGRGHTFVEIEKSSALILENNIEPGLQMMIGLPGDNPEKVRKTAEGIIKLGAKSTRIYPTLVIENTKLADLYRQGDYTPLSLEEAVNQIKEIVPLFEHAGVRILRMGLHPSEELSNDKSLLAGPFHPAFGQLVYSAIWKEILERKLSEINLSRNAEIVFEVAPSQINAAVGHNGSNKKLLSEKCASVKFRTNSKLKNRDCKVTVQKEK
jgi:histone acetyltransferase (RNA polymerase elongator complex component)